MAIIRYHGMYCVNIYNLVLLLCPYLHILASKHQTNIIIMTMNPTTFIVNLQVINHSFNSMWDCMSVLVVNRSNIPRTMNQEQNRIHHTSYMMYSVLFPFSRFLIGWILPFNSGFLKYLTVRDDFTITNVLRS